MKKILIFLVLFISLFAMVSCNPEAAKKPVDNSDNNGSDNLIEYKGLVTTVNNSNYANQDGHFDFFASYNNASIDDAKKGTNLTLYNTSSVVSKGEDKGYTSDCIFVAYAGNEGEDGKHDIEIPFYNLIITGSYETIYIGSVSGNFVNITLPETAKEVVINCGTIMHMNIPASVETLIINARLEDVTIEEGAKFSIYGDFDSPKNSQDETYIESYGTSNKGIYKNDNETLVKALSPSTFDKYFKNEQIKTIADLIAKKDELGESFKFDEKFFNKVTYVDEFIIDESVETISDGAFAFVRIKNITIPSNVRKVGSFVFLKCQSLNKVEIEGDNIEFGTNVFQNCDELEGIPEEYVNSLKGVLEFEFAGCEKLKSIELPETVTELGDYSFFEFKDGLEITIQKNLEAISVDWVGSLSDRTSGEIKIIFNGSQDDWDKNHPELKSSERPPYSWNTGFVVNILNSGKQQMNNI